MSAIHVTDFDPSRLQFSDPKIVEGDTGNFVKCDVQYVYDDGTPSNLFVVLPTNFCFGVSPIYMYGKERTPDTVTGKYQVAYSVTSQETKDEPTKEEKAIFTLNEGFKKRLRDYVIENAAELGTGFEDVIDNEVLLSRKVKDLIKPGMMQDPKYPKNKLKKVIDPTKTYKWYIKLWQSQKNGGRMLTTMRGPGDKLVNPLKYLNVWGDITPVVLISWVYFDGDKGASAQCLLSEANFVPKNATRPRFLPENTAPIEEDDGEVDEEEAELLASRERRKPNPAELLGDGDEADSSTPESTADPNEDIVAAKTTKTKTKTKAKAKPKVVTEDEDEEEVVVKPKTKPKTRKPKPPVVEDDDE
uniref:Uncharacterized protein n=1 Tax=viral metagenome TaxID=1070528 RepID=A0A6C0LXS2_9ZZZZ